MTGEQENLYREYIPWGMPSKLYYDFSPGANQRRTEWMHANAGLPIDAAAERFGLSTRETEALDRQLQTPQSDIGELAVWHS
jgi:hypothetical protein